MSFYTTVQSDYKKYRAYHRYSRPLTIFLIDFMTSAFKILVVAFVGWFLYKQLVGNATGSSVAYADRPATQTVNVPLPEAQSPATSAPEVPTGFFDKETHWSDASRQDTQDQNVQREKPPGPDLQSKNLQSQDVAGIEQNQGDLDAGEGEQIVLAQSDEQVALADIEPVVSVQGSSGKGSQPLGTFPSREPVPVDSQERTVVHAELRLGARWIQVQDPDNYTIQYSTSPNIAYLDDFRSQFPPQMKPVLFQFDRAPELSPVYGVVHGVYKTANEARDALGRVPENLRQSQPWVRRMNQVQKVAVSP